MERFSVPATSAVSLSDPFFAPRVEANRTATIPACLRFCEETHRLESFDLKWKDGDKWYPHIYWDSDVAKVVEGMARELARRPDPALAERLDAVARRIVAAQQPDGYLNTHFTQVEPEKRWSNLHECHELYCAGHLIEAAVAHFEATGERFFLDAMRRYADCIAKTFGRKRGQKRGYPGHEELELALCRLADATGERKYLDLAAYFVDERGRKPNYYVKKEGWQEGRLTYLQAHEPPREQREAVGHAVRWAYLCCGMADVAAATGDAGLFDACRAMWENATGRRMLVTGGIGTTREGEAFERDFKLGNLTAYAESCAAIGLALFSRRMHEITGEGRYLDVLERALYNGIPSGISLSGDRFFYQNPLASNADSPYDRERQSWFSCSCCPTNFARFWPQAAQLCWALSPGEVRLCVPAASELKLENGLCLKVESRYPYDGKVAVRVSGDARPAGTSAGAQARSAARSLAPFALSLRIPDWCPKFSLAVNGKRVAAKAKDGFVSIERLWKPGDEVALDLAMPVRVLRAHDAVEADAGRIALQRGPLVYALESVDNGPGLHRISIPAKQAFRLVRAKGLPRGTVAIAGKAFETTRPGDALYSAAAPRTRLRRFVAIPYALWQNRGLSEMQVWTRES
ncbi:MAG: glycoside hydrolase family 127 protein [Kiritimatiellae bacterium]|nr:glycoside hydrolase family 127 protein [Kiritimatiellia bacterium]MBR1836311.1 glycoside hydrolase family 127 protein [Kiritimatiellia bacterium]